MSLPTLSLTISDTLYSEDRWIYCMKPNASRKPQKKNYCLGILFSLEHHYTFVSDKGLTVAYCIRMRSIEEVTQLAGLPSQCGVSLTFDLEWRLRALRGATVRWGLRWSCIKALLHPSLAVRPLFPRPGHGLVRAHVLGQVVVAHEDARTQGAAELLGARVRLQVALQLVGAGEALAAEEPVADEGPVSAVPAQVGLQVGGLGVRFAASRNVTVVHVLPPPVVRALAQLLGVDAVGTPAHRLTRAPGGGATLRLGPDRGGALLRFLQGVLVGLHHLRAQRLHLEGVLGVEVSRVGGRGQLGLRQRAQLGLRAVRSQGRLQAHGAPGAHGLQAHTLPRLQVHPAPCPGVEVPPGWDVHFF